MNAKEFKINDVVFAPETAFAVEPIPSAPIPFDRLWAVFSAEVYREHDGP